MALSVPFLSAFWFAPDLLLGRVEDIIQRLTSRQSGVQALTWNTKMSRPRRRSHGQSVPCDQPIHAGVIALHHTSRPSAVASRVGTIVVDSVKTLIRWTRPHVSQERAEVIAPFLTHGDASTSITVKIRRSRVVASRLCVLPRGIFARFTGTVDRLRSFLAAATSGSPNPEGRSSRYGFVTAIASTVPHLPALSTISLSENSQLPEPLSNHA